MTEIADLQPNAVSQLRADIQALRMDVGPLAARLEAIEGQCASIMTLLTALKAGQSEGPRKSEFIGKRG